MSDTINVDAVNIDTSTDRVQLDSSLPDVNIDVTHAITAQVEPDSYVIGSIGYSTSMPKWISTAIMEAVKDSIGNGSTLAEALNSLRTELLDSISLGVNQAITQIENAYVSNSSLTTTLASEIANSRAALLTNIQTYSDETKAVATDVNLMKASFGNDISANAINAFIGNIAVTRATPNDVFTATTEALSATYNDQQAQITTMQEVTITPEGYHLGASKLATAPDGSITGWQFTDGTGVQSEFKIAADTFKVVGTTNPNYVPLYFDNVSKDLVFNGKVTFTSGGSTTTGSLNEAITAGVTQVAVGDKNVNITDNLIPTTSLVSDINNAGYQFIGNPIKAAAAGIATFSEPQITLDLNDEVYSPYVDELFAAYYYKFGISNISDLNTFKVIAIANDNTVIEIPLVYNMLGGNILVNNGTWYIVDGIINPNLGNGTTYSGSIRLADGTKIGEVQNIRMTTNAVKMSLGWKFNAVISRPKLAKITADTITSSYATTDYVNTTTIDGGRIATGRIQSNNGSTYFDLNNNQIKMNNGNFILDSTAVGTTSNPNIKGGYIKGTTLEGASIIGASIDVTTDITAPIVYGDTFRIRAQGYPNNSGSPVAQGVNLTVYGNGYSSGYIHSRFCSPNSVLTIRVFYNLPFVSPGGGVYVHIQESVYGGPWVTVSTTAVDTSYADQTGAAYYTKPFTNSTYYYNYRSTFTRQYPGGYYPGTTSTPEIVLTN